MGTPAGLRIFKLFAASICCVLLACSQASAAKGSGKKTAAPPKEPPMRVYIVRSAQEGCEPTCPEWIAAQGQIEAGSPARFKKVLSQLGGRKLPVLINSGGGSADEALAIGRLLRSQGLDVAVTKTVFTPCAPEAAACRKKEKTPLRGLPDTATSICASSCAFILAAGTRRFVGTSAFVGVHRLATIQMKILRTYRMVPYRTREGAVRYKRNLLSEKVVSKRQISAPQKIYSRFEKYFIEMDISDDIMPLILETAHSSVHWLTQQELRSTRIATHRMNGEQLLRGAVAPENGWADIAQGGAIVESPPADMNCDRFGGSPIACSLPLVSGGASSSFGDITPFDGESSGSSQ